MRRAVVPIPELGSPAKLNPFPSKLICSMFARPHFSSRLLICRFADVRWQAASIAIPTAIVLTLESVHQSVHQPVSQSLSQSVSQFDCDSKRLVYALIVTWLLLFWLHLQTIESVAALSRQHPRARQTRQQNAWMFLQIYIDCHSPHSTSDSDSDLDSDLDSISNSQQSSPVD